MNNAIMFAVFAISFLLCTTSFAQEPATTPDYRWVNGTWKGPVQNGGELVMTLEVVNNHEIKGRGRVWHGGTIVASASQITGSIEGEAVMLEVYYSGPGTATKYDLKFVDG